MNNDHPAVKFLYYSGACNAALDFVKSQPNPQVAWEKCERFDWMCWLLRRIDSSANRKLVRLAVKTAMKVRKTQPANKFQDDCLAAAYLYVNKKIGACAFNEVLKSFYRKERISTKPHGKDFGAVVNALEAVDCLIHGPDYLVPYRAMNSIHCAVEATSNSSYVSQQRSWCDFLREYFPKVPWRRDK